MPGNTATRVRRTPGPATTTLPAAKRTRFTDDDTANPPHLW
jgi:hypothetical protein